MFVLLVVADGKQTGAVDTVLVLAPVSRIRKKMLLHGGPAKTAFSMWPS